MLRISPAILNPNAVIPAVKDGYDTGERHVRIGVFPVGVEVDAFNRMARRSLRSSFVEDVLASLSGRAMIIGVDRLDYSKGIGFRMEAFERFLASNPEWRNNVTYLQITPKSHRRSASSSMTARLS